MEHVTDLATAYGVLFAMLRPGGWMSHQIDFRAHGTATAWNGHWQYSETAWKLLVGRRPFLINRAPCSTHVERIKAAGFDIVRRMDNPRNDGLPRSRLARRWQHLADADLHCSGTFIVARKP
jgi:hypothetical protein